MRQFILLSTLLIIVAVCRQPVAAPLNPAQPGALILAQLRGQNTFTLDAVKQEIVSLKNDKSYSHLFAKLRLEDLEASPALLNALADKRNLTAALTQLIQAQPDQAKALIRAAFVLFPLDRYETYRALLSQDIVAKGKLRQWASAVGMLTTPLYPAEQFDAKGVLVAPLIESLSITLAGQPADTRAKVAYRPVDATGATGDWQAAKALSYEPVTGYLTGPVVYLEPATRYALKITLTHADGTRQELTTDATTRPDSPPVDPDKVYHLADIYDGGTLDLSKLNINGNADGWAKIIGDPNLPIVAGEGKKHAINIGDASYVLFENITVRGGRTHSVYAEKAHHIWIDGCDIAQWGREPNIIKDGIAYELEDAQPINYDSALYFRRSGVITVENCQVHDPTPYANDWRAGHPKGPNAFFAHANHPNPAYKGQVILRNNTFTGHPEHRFNDVIEGRKNGEPLGGFVRDSAIYNNTLRYAQDDGIEIDGGQYNVLVYNNDIAHSYTGISAIPSRIGPAFIFNNRVQALGDSTGKQWAAVKLGGLLAGPAGTTHVYHNLLTVGRNGIAASRFQQDSTLLTNAQNNIIVTANDANMVGYGVYDPQRYSGSQFINNFMLNLSSQAPKTKATIQVPYAYSPDKLSRARDFYEAERQAQLPARPGYMINNFSQTSADGEYFLNGVLH